MKKSVLRQILEYVKPYYKQQVLGLFFTVLYSTTLFLTPLISKHLIDNVIGTDTIEGIISGIMLFCLVCLAQPITSYIKDALFVRVGEKTAYDIRGRMFKGILYAPMRDIEAKTTGEVVSRISQDGMMASRIISELAVGIIKNILICIMIVAGLLLLSPLLSGISIGLFLLSMILTSRMSGAFEAIQEDVQKGHDAMCGDVDDLVKTAPLIKGYGLEEKFEDAFNEVLDSVKKVNTKAMLHSARIQNISSAIMVIILCVLYGGGSVMVLYGQMTIGTVIGLGLYFQLLTQPVYELMQQKSAIHKAVPILRRIKEYENIEPEEGIRDHREMSSVDHTVLIDGLIATCGLSLKNISFSYDDSPVIENLSLDLPAKGLVVIQGASGCGKTTLLSLISGLYGPDQGHFEVACGQKSHVLGLKKLRQRTAYVQQQPKVYPCIKNKLSENRGMLSKLERDFIEALEKSFLISAESSTYSGGEMQRQALISAIYKRAPIWILDEPLSALDQRNKDFIVSHIKGLKSEKLILVAAHDLVWHEHADMVYKMQGPGEVTCVLKRTAS